MTFKEYLLEKCKTCTDRCESCEDYKSCDCEKCKQKSEEEK